MTSLQEPATRECKIESTPVKGYVHSLETFGLVDGPGVRFVVFLQGCRMRCAYCHNPETWAIGGEENSLSKAKLWTPEDLWKQASRYRKYWGKKGGITVSGGEPLLQIDFLTRLFELAKEAGVHTTLDTAGNPFTFEEPFYGKFERLMKSTDLVMLDLKEMDSKRHKALCGVSNGNIQQMARWLSDYGKDMWIRHVLVPGLTDQEDDLMAMRDFIESLDTVRRVEVLPYHALGIPKWEALGIPYRLKDVMPPEEDAVKRAEEILRVEAYNGKAAQKAS